MKQIVAAAAAFLPVKLQTLQDGKQASKQASDQAREREEFLQKPFAETQSPFTLMQPAY